MKLRDGGKKKGESFGESGKIPLVKLTGFAVI